MHIWCENRKKKKHWITIFDLWFGVLIFNKSFEFLALHMPWWFLSEPFISTSVILLSLMLANREKTYNFRRGFPILTQMSRQMVVLKKKMVVLNKKKRSIFLLQPSIPLGRLFLIKIWNKLWKSQDGNHIIRKKYCFNFF